MNSRTLLLTALTCGISIASHGQSINLGTAADFALFSGVGAVTNSGNSHVTGHVGSNSGSSTGFGNVNGVMHDNDGASAQASTDLLAAYDQLQATIPTFFHDSLLGNGQVLTAGVHSISSASALNLVLSLNAQNNPNAVFIIKIQGAFSTGAGSQVKLINGAKACNVYWMIEGLVSMAAGTSMKGTIVANNAAINMNVNDTLEGRALSTNGAVTLNGALVYTPTGCGSGQLTGPGAPPLGAMACYSLFSASGPVSNSGVTFVNGDVGTNSGLTTGFNAEYVNGMIHAIPDASTAQCSADLAIAYDYINTLPYDIELLYPAQFGRNLVLTPHTYLLNAATVLTDTLFLDARGNTNAVFVFKINGALSTSTYSRIVLRNGARSTHVFWKVEGAVNINDHSIFRGNLICNNGALGAINTGVILDGRAFTTTGALTTTAITTTMACDLTTGLASIENTGNVEITIFPNPFTNSISVQLNDNSIRNGVFTLYNALGAEVSSTDLRNQLNTISTTACITGVYYYQISGANGIVQTGKLIAQP